MSGLIAGRIYGKELAPARIRYEEVLRRLVATHEEGLAAPWRLERVPAEYLQTMKRGIVTFEVPIVRLEGKLKLSQNRSPADRAGARGVGAACGGRSARYAGVDAGAQRLPLMDGCGCLV